MVQQNAAFGFANTLAHELFTRCLLDNGEGFTLHRTLGIYRQHFIRTENGWLCDRSPDAASIMQMTAQVRQLVEQFPPLRATYPHTVTQDDRDSTTQSATWVTSMAETCITVPADFVRAHNGSAYLEQLTREQSSAITALAEDIRQRLMRYEIRTAQMFSKDDTCYPIHFAVQQDAIVTEIWYLPLKKHSIAPLFTENAQCAMARAMASALAESLHCETTVRCMITQGFHCAYTVQLTIKDTLA